MTSVPRTGAQDEYYGGSTVAADGERAYVGLSDGTVHAVDLGSGVVRWSLDVSADAAPVDPAFGAAGGRFRLYLTATDEAVVLGSNTGAVRAIDPASGTVNWSYATAGSTGRVVPVGDRLVVGQVVGRNDLGYIGPGSDGSGFVIDDGEVSGPNATVRAVSVTDGAVLWETPVPHREALPVLAGDTVVVASSDDTDGVVLGLDPDTGLQRWRFDAGPQLLTPVAGAGHVFVIGADNLVALDPRSGEVNWEVGEFADLVDLPSEFGTGAGIESWPVAVAATDEEVVAVQGGAIWYALSLDPDSGNCRWAKFDNGEGGFSIQAVGDDVWVQRTNCAPVVYERLSGEPLAWINPQASASQPGTFEQHYCGSYPDIALADANDGVVATGLTNVMAVQR